MIYTNKQGENMNKIKIICVISIIIVIVALVLLLIYRGKVESFVNNANAIPEENNDKKDEVNIKKEEVTPTNV